MKEKNNRPNEGIDGLWIVYPVFLIFVVLFLFLFIPMWNGYVDPILSQGELCEQTNLTSCYSLTDGFEMLEMMR